jgi:hypothetical protein
MRAPLHLAVAAAAAAALAGCGDGAAGPVAPERGAAATPRPALCATLRARVTGRVTAPGATELSGLALSRTQAGVLWAHNDSGDRARVLALTPDGALLADLAVPGAENVDWEDIAVGPAPGGGAALHLADIGDNLGRRPSIAVYRVPEPRLTGPRTGVTAPAERLDLRYPGGRRFDAEALLVDPATGGLAIVTKSFAGASAVYVPARPPRPGVTRTLRRVATLSLGPGGAVTAGGVSGDGRTIVLRTYDRALVWRRPAGAGLGAALRARPCTARADLLREGQGEALALTRDGRAFFTVPEGPRPALRRYAPR